ncbi:sugar transferase [Sporosarcina thermotolerans]|uniref:Sugar transferase n=1 Tax=Sporosarcina thermotolerans TaxID=633404 RepID=A0AAW9A7U0_9BACL|nr:sugar transferase [Sporosarcina thermotolerans]MDW0116284.1 sugar transferase [Sporosarcina thermotolerans]WHT48258.1 sugar transferase [Sporosarcina thermotolerans]
MVFRKWNDLPDILQNDKVKKYYDVLDEKRFDLFIKRIFDFTVAVFLLIILSPLFIIISIAIKLDSKGPVMFRQIRVTQYCNQFKIWKFRTMVNNADIIGTQVTTKNDVRVTNVGRLLRKSRLDEIPQLINIILGDMSFVGTRPEVVKYVEMYTDEMKATLLLPAGVTSKASILYKNEESLMANVNNADDIYINEVLPQKMKYNLRSILSFSIFSEIKTMIETVISVIKKDGSSDLVVKVESSRNSKPI